MKADVLRKKYPKFIYRSYDYKINEGNLEISFVFEIPPDIIFRPRITINETRSDRVSSDNLVFHLGLIEMLSYWKTTCSPEIVIEAGYLDKNQIDWWQNLIMNGMGQFFYENKISFQKPEFEINCQRKHPIVENNFQDKYLVPVGGGRDSIVTLEKMKKAGKKINAFVVNPTRAAEDVLEVAGIKNPIIIKRIIDLKLLELNKKGYLNGHTPFTALLSFLSVLCAVLLGYKNIAFSNEKSANEGNLKYLGKTVNHQWSKSSEFERMFKNYCKKYLVGNLNYFSYLRKYTDLEISRMFAKYPKYFPVFSSCNMGKKTGKRWCGKCPKCLFVYLTLYPYLDKKQMLKIFGKDLFKDKSLTPLIKSLIGQGSHKPFECVGTYKENKKAFKLSLKKKPFGKLKADHFLGS